MPDQFPVANASSSSSPTRAASKRCCAPIPLVAATILTFAGVQPVSAADKPATGNAWLTPELLAAGFKLLPHARPLLDTLLDFRPAVPPLTIPVGPPALVNVNVSIDLSGLMSNRAQVAEQLQREKNDLVRRQLDLLARQLDVQIEQAKTAARAADDARGHFDYVQKRDESLLRRLDYPPHPGKLVVVVADFSCGDTGEGAEVADEIANALNELKDRCGIGIEVMAGEVKPGVVIRSEQMARDVGRHFPPGTCYAVVWGTLSPRTVGKFRPHVTCVMKVSEAAGVGTSYSLDLDAQSLPLGADGEAARRSRHEQLVAFACAAVPGCYAAYEVSRERVPDLSRLIAYLGEASDTARRLRAELAPLSRWPATVARTEFRHLRRLSQVSGDAEYPELVLNTRDGSLMALVTDPPAKPNGPARPHRFRGPAGDEYLGYADVTEVTNRQYLKFLEEKGNRERGGAVGLLIDPEHAHIYADVPGEFRLVSLPNDPTGSKHRFADRPVFNVSYFGAEDYCAWAGKAVPRAAEWRAAARPAAGSAYPWGDGFDRADVCACKKSAADPYANHPRPVGSFAGSDRSRVGCLDLGGNVAEWCEEFAAGSQSDRVVCGGSYDDADPAVFRIDHSRAVPQTRHQRWVGFRGVVRVPVGP